MFADRIPVDNVDTVDTLRAENMTLKIQCNKLEREAVELRHTLDLSLTKAGSWGGMKQRVTLFKPQSVVAERLWTTAADGSEYLNEGSEVVEAIEQQLHEKTALVDQLQQTNFHLQETVTSLEHRLKIQEQQLQSAPQQKSTTSSTTYFQSQIRFLHDELERAESMAATIRRECVEELRMSNEQFNRLMEEKDARIRQLEDETSKLRSVAGISKKAKWEHGEDLMTRCKLLETQLATVLAEKNVLQVERGDIMMRLRKFESAAKERQHAVEEAQKLAAVESSVSSEHARRLIAIIANLTEDKTHVTEQLREANARLNTPKQSVEVQVFPLALQQASQTDTAPSTEEVGCQVDSVGSLPPETRSVQAVRHLLEQKCSEADDLRAKLEQLSYVHQETLQMLEATKQRLSQELTRRKSLEEDVESQSLQLHSLQQKTSYQLSVDREKDVLLQQAEARQHEAQTKLLKSEEEYRRLEADLTKHRSDLHHLVANQNYNSTQVNQLSLENEGLRVEIQKLLQREAQCNYTIRAKDVEIAEILAAYQQSTKEMELIGNSCHTLEKENENLRAVIASREERNIHLQEQVAHLHAREQQLSLDLQSFEHEGGQLHRRFTQSEIRSAQLEAQVHECQQTIHSFERVNEELQRSLAELSKQLVVRDNESLLLRQRCDSLEQECTALNTAHRSESQRLKELEESNARLVVRNIMSTSQAQQQQMTSESHRIVALERELAAARDSLGKTAAALRKSNDDTAELHQELGRAEQRRAEVESALAEVTNTKQRLERLLSEQAATLSQLSK